MNWHVWLNVALLAIVIGGVGVGLATPDAPQPITAHQVQYAIIGAERPKMGPREKEFWVSAIAAAARKYSLPPEVLTAKIAQESQFNQSAVSIKNARCAAQIMPMHYKSFEEIREIEDCLGRGAKILADELKNCGTIEIALRCYYAGSLNVKSTPDQGRKLYRFYSDAILSRVYLAEQGLRAAEKR